MSGKYDVVISGVAGVFPDCDDVDELVQKLLDGTDLVNVDNRRWTPGEWDVPSSTGKIKSPSNFDVPLFGMARNLMEITDPSYRLAIMQGYKAVCDAGVNPKELSGSNTAVIMSCFVSDLEADSVIINDPSKAGTYGIVANARTMQANRLSFILNLKGPSYALSTSWCGGSQVIEAACDLISSGQATAAIVGCSSLMHRPEFSIHFQALGRLSEDGATRCFSSDAAGYARSESVVAMFLQRAQDARRCYGTILGIQTIHTGLRSNGFMDMDPERFEQFLQTLYKDAGVDPKEISYYEACGWASKRLEAKELNAAAKVFLPGRTKPLKIGSVKSNLGHTEGSSTMVSLVKTLIALDRGIITPNVHYSSPNPLIPGLVSGELEVVTKSTKIDGEVVGVTDIGLTGSTFSHVIVGRNPKVKPPLPARNELPSDGIPRLVLLSDRNENNLQLNIMQLESQPIDEEFCCLINQLGRDGVRGELYRGYSVLKDSSKPCNQIETFERVNARRPIWFMFSGMGSQWPAMGKQLMKLPVFARAVHKCHEILFPRGLDLIGILSNKDPKVFDSIINCFVGIAAVQIGLVDVLKEVGVVPNGIIGHSVGELGCAYADGCLTLEQVILSAYARGKASVEAPLIKGTMAAVGMAYNEIKNQLPESIDVACHNSNSSCTLSGPSEDMEKFIGDLKRRGVFAKLVNVANIAYHSRYIKPAAPLLLNYLKPIISGRVLRSTKWLSSSVAESQWETDLSKYSSADYYTNNLLSPVLFEEVGRHVPDDAILIEIAPHGLLQAIVKKSHPKVTHIPLTSRFDDDNLTHLLGALGKLYLNGVPVDVQRLYPTVTYPVSRGTPALTRFIGMNMEHVTSTRLEIPRPECYFKRYSISIQDQKYAWLTSHKMKGRMILPNSYFLTEVAELSSEATKRWDTIVAYEKLKFQTKGEVSFTGASLDIDLMLHRGTGSFAFTLASDNAAISSGSMKIIDATEFSSIERYLTVSDKNENYVHHDGRDVLAFMKSYGLDLEDEFALIKRVGLDETSLNATVSWNGNEVAYLNSLLALIGFFHTKLYDCLHVVSEIHQLIVDFSQVRDLKPQDIDVAYDKKAGILRCNGVLLFRPETKDIVYNTYGEDRVLECHRFVPYDFGEMKSLDLAISICYQLILENSTVPHGALPEIRALCIGENMFDGLTALSTTCRELNVSHVSSEQVLVDQQLPQLTGEMLWIASSNVLSLKTIDRIRTVAPRCFILMLNDHEMPEASKFCQMFSFSVGFVKYTLWSTFSNTPNTVERVPVHLDGDYMKLLESKLIRAYKNTSESGKVTELVYLVGNVGSMSTILEVLDETRKLPYHHLLRYFFEDRKSNIKTSLAKLKRDLKMNVIWNGTWGSIKSVALEDSLDAYETPAVGSSFFSISSIIELTSKPTALGLNLNDVTGSLDDDELGAFDYANAKSMGIGTYDVLSRKFIPDDILQWEKPAQWSVSQAATVPLLYSLAMHILGVKSHICWEMDSILISQGLLPLSQALLQLVINGPTEVYVTVNGEEERKQIRKMFPKLRSENIFDCSKNRFDVALLLKTKGVGVDKIVNTFKDPDMMKCCTNCVGDYGVITQVSMNPSMTKSTMGMREFNREIKVVGINVDAVLNLSQKEKTHLRDEVAAAIIDGRVEPLVQLPVPRESSNLEVVKHLTSAKTKVVVNLGNEHGEEDIKTGAIFKCSPHDDYLLLCGGDHESANWLDLTSWLVRRGARNITVLLEDRAETGLIDLRTESLKHKYSSINLAIKSTEGLSYEKLVNNHIAKTTKDVTPKLSGVFVLNCQRKLVEGIDEFLEKRGHSCDFICFGSGGEKTCEQRSKRGLTSLCIRFENDRSNFETAVEHLDVLISQSRKDPIVTVRKYSSRVSSAKKSFAPRDISELQECLCWNTPKWEFKEITTTAPSKKYNKEVSPVFIFPGLQLENSRKLAHKLVYPALEVRLTKNTDDISYMATEICDLMSASGKNMFTLVAVGCGGILALHVAAGLESEGKIVRLILVDAGPSDILEWASNFLKDPTPLVSKYANVQDEVNLEVQTKNTTWEETVTKLVSRSKLSPDKKETVIVGINFLRRCLQGIIDGKPPMYKLKRPCYLFKRDSTELAGQSGLEKYLQEEAVVKVMKSNTEADVINLTEEINSLVLFETEDAANPPREDYLRVKFIKT